MVWRDTPALEGGSFELVLGYNGIKKGWVGAVECRLGCWGIVTSRLQLVPMLPSTCGCRERFLLSSPGDINSEE